jgi:hypothetical protein
MKSSWIGMGLALALLAPPLPADEQRAPATHPSAHTVQVPYKLTETQHVMVRAKINGKGPFNFIIDTGAPLLFVSTAVGKQVGLASDKKGWATLDRFEIEGGVVQTKVRCRVETPFQLEGMNSMGLAGAELHGIIGYTVLAHYRMEFDFTRDKMGWTRLDFTPPPPLPFSGNKKDATAGIENMAGLMKLASFFMGKKGPPDVAPRGFLGLQLLDLEGAVTVKGALPSSPAASANFKPGDRIARINGTTVASLGEVATATAKVRVGDVIRLTIVRGLERMELAVRATEGL